MIRRPVEPTVWWAYAAIVVGLVLSVAAWAYNFGPYKQWIRWDGVPVSMTWGQATVCLWPQLTMVCRESFTASGITDLGPVTRFQMMNYLPLIMGFVVCGFGLHARYGRRPKTIILEGPAVGDFPALLAETKRETRDKAESLPMFNGWALPAQRQSLGIMLIGQPGSGKTNVLRYIQKSLSERGDRQVIFAAKTNVYGNTPPVVLRDGNTDVDPILINPADRRSWIWDIAKDIDGEASCGSVARRLVRGKDDFWKDAAVAVITVMLVKLHRTKRHRWTWAELFNECNRSQEELAKDAREYYPDAVKQIEVTDKQFQGTHSTLSNELQNLKLLAIAWPSYENRRTISASQFLHGSKYPRTLVVGFSADHPELSEAWIPIFMTFVCRAVFHTDYKVDKTNRTWVILDELDKLKKVEGINNLISAGREQGVSVILGIQDVSQIDKVYGQDATNLWMTSMQTKIVGRMDAGNSAQWLSESLGKTRVRTVQWKAGETNVLEWKDEERYALRDNDLNHEFKVIEGKGAWMGVLGVGRDHHHVFVPFMPYHSYRSSFEPAPWITADRGDRSHLS